MICDGDTIGVFQIESRAQIQMLPRTRPRNLDDLAVQVAIVRPGPIIGGAVKPYVEHRHHERTSFLPVEPEYDHPCLEHDLAETHGVVLYQEQVLQVAMAYAGFSPGEAEGFRRAMSRKRSQEAMEQLHEDFILRAIEHHKHDKEHPVTREKAEKVFKKLSGFASYGFPKAHAVAFALLAFQSCYLKYYYPAEFLCALLNNQPMGFYPPHVLINDAKRHGLRILAPDINLSGVRCTLDRSNGIRIGLGYVKGLGAEAAQTIVLERQANGPYQSLADFIRRVPLSTARGREHDRGRSVRSFRHRTTRSALADRAFIAARGFGTKRTTENGRQLPLDLPIHQDQVDVRPMGAWDQMAASYAILGLSPRYHPFSLLRPHLPKEYTSIADLERLPHKSVITIAGLVVCRQRPGTARDVTFLLVEDEYGLVNVIVYQGLYNQQRMVVRGEPFVVITGELRKESDTINIVAGAIQRLEKGRDQFEKLHSQARNLDDTPPRFESDRKPVRSRTLVTVAPESHDYH